MVVPVPRGGAASGIDIAPVDGDGTTALRTGRGDGKTSDLKIGVGGQRRHDTCTTGIVGLGGGVTGAVLEHVVVAIDGDGSRDVAHTWVAVGQAETVGTRLEAGECGQAA